MRKLIIFAVVLVVVATLALFGYQRRLQASTLPGLYEEYSLRGPKHDIQSPFSGVVLVARDGEVVFEQAYGYTDKKRSEPLETDSRFLVGAQAKPFTAVLVAQQAEAGTLDLDATVADYLPDFPAEIGSRITLHQLLTHSSGLPREDLPDEELELEHRPGVNYTYSNFGYDLLVRVLEATAGKSYGELLAAGIVEPLGLTGTGYAVDDALTTEVVKGFQFREHPMPVAMFTPVVGSYSARRMPAGAAFTTAADFYRFSRALRDGELLSAEMTARLLEPAVQGAAYGWFRNRDWVLSWHPQAQLYTHIGRLGGHSTMAALYDDGTDVIVMSNVDPLSLNKVLFDTWLAAHELQELPNDIPHPSLASSARFVRGGGLEAFDNYYETMSERAGYPIEPDRSNVEKVLRLLLRGGHYDDAVVVADRIGQRWGPENDAHLNTIGYLFLREDRHEDARRYFERNVELHPTVPNVHDSLGEACEEQGDFDAAHESYSRAIEVARASGDGFVAFYEDRVRDLERKAASESAAPAAPATPGS